MAQCDQCKLKPDCHRGWKTSGDQATNCVSFTSIRTNADRIRSMTDEELEMFMEEIASSGIYLMVDKDWTGDWLDWLKQESDGE